MIFWNGIPKTDQHMNGHKYIEYKMKIQFRPNILSDKTDK